MHRLLASVSALLMVFGLLLVAPAEPVLAQAADGDDEFKIVYAAVRQGDGALYQGPCGEVAVIDTPAHRAGDVVSALDAHFGSRTITWANASHYHADHMGGFADLDATAGVSIATVYDRGGDRDAFDSNAYRAYHDWLAADGSPDRRQVRIGDRLTLCSGEQQVTFDVVSVGIDGLAAGGVSVRNEDDKSVCLRIAYRSFRLLSDRLDGTPDGGL